MSVSTYKELLEHKDCQLVLAFYGDIESPTNVGVECDDCCEVIYSQDNPENGNDEEEYRKQAGGATFEKLAKHIDCSGVKLVKMARGAKVVCRDCGNTLLAFRKG
jgi:hypothetical protein